MNRILIIILRTFSIFTLSMYFRQWKVVGKDKIPTKRPIIFAANHQNAFLDAIILTCSSRKLPYYLARAEVFKGKFAKIMLKIIRIMPIYRFRDGLGNVKKNDEILANCSALLSKGEMLTMFPEGNHGDKWQLRPLQRGVSRIAISSEAANNWLLNIAIVPVGIQYENAGTFRSRVLVSFGDPIHVGDYKETYLENSREALEKTKDDLADSMSELIVNIPEENYESDYSQLQNCRPYLRNYRKQVEADREIVASLQKGTELPKSSRGKYIIYNPLAYVLAPWAWINNILPNLLLKSFIKKKVKDPVFKDSLNWVFGTFLLPFYYLVIALIIGFSTANWWLALIYFISHPITVFLGGFDVLKKIKKAF